MWSPIYNLSNTGHFFWRCNSETKEEMSLFIPLPPPWAMAMLHSAVEISILILVCFCQFDRCLWSTQGSITKSLKERKKNSFLLPGIAKARSGS